MCLWWSSVAPRPEDFTMSAFSRIVDQEVLTFERSPDGFRDIETGSLWAIEGNAVSGPLRGTRLQPVRWQYIRWHAWAYPHPTTELFISEQLRLPYPEFPSCPQVQSLREVLAKLAGGDAELTFSHVLVELALPQEATGGICVYLDEERLNLHRFTSPEAAADYVALQGAQFCMPFDVKLGRKRAARSRSVVLESDPVGSTPNRRKPCDTPTTKAPGPGSSWNTRRPIRANPPKVTSLP